MVPCPISSLWFCFYLCFNLITYCNLSSFILSSTFSITGEVLTGFQPSFVGSDTDWLASSYVDITAELDSKHPFPHVSGANRLLITLCLSLGSPFTAQTSKLSVFVYEKLPQFSYNNFHTHFMLFLFYAILLSEKKSYSFLHFYTFTYSHLFSCRAFVSGCDLLDFLHHSQSMVISSPKYFLK